MTTSDTPWTSKLILEAATVPLPENHTVVSDAAGNPIAWFKDGRDADLVIEEMKGEPREDLRRQIEDLKSEVEALEEESAKMDKENEDLEEKVKKFEALQPQQPAA